MEPAVRDAVGDESERPPSRRERQRQATAEEIKQVARELMAEEGSGSLNLRAVARRMGMTPSALYRYYPSRDAILTALIVEAFDQIGAAVEEAMAAAPADRTCTRVLAGTHAFRRWALAHPHEYGLIYGTPVPGYHAPPDRSTAAALRTPMAMLAELARAIEIGMLVPPPDDQVPPRVLELLGAATELPPGLSAASFAASLQFWVVMLGAMTAEIFGHVPHPVMVEAGDLFFDHLIRQALLAMGLDRAAVDQAISPAG